LRPSGVGAKESDGGHRIKAGFWFIATIEHDPLITFTAHQAIGARLDGTAEARFREDIDPDFALRCFVTCAHCRKPMTAWWSTGRRQKYPYCLFGPT
jgi:hypothetical protein